MKTAVSNHKEQITIWYKFNKKSENFEYSHIKDGWDNESKPIWSDKNERWAKELAYKGKSDIASFKVVYND